MAWLRANAAVGVPVLAVTAAAGVALAAQAGAFDGLTGDNGPAAVAGRGHASGHGQANPAPEPSQFGHEPDTAGKPAATGTKKPAGKSGATTEAAEVPAASGAVQQSDVPVSGAEAPPAAGLEGAQAAAPAPASGEAATRSPSTGSPTEAAEPEQEPSEDAGNVDSRQTTTKAAPAPTTASAPAPGTTTATAPSTSTAPTTVPSLLSSVLGADSGISVLTVGGSLLGR